jgi:cytochrome c biogenesis factor
MFYLGLISFAASMLVMLIAIILTIFQLIKRQTILTKLSITLASVSFGLHTLSILTLMAMQVLQDYSISYVVSVVNSVMPTILKMTSLGRSGGVTLFLGLDSQPGLIHLTACPPSDPGWLVFSVHGFKLALLRRAFTLC